MLQWIVSFSCNVVFVMMRSRISHSHSRRYWNKFAAVSNFVGCTTPTIFHNYTGHSRSHWCFQTSYARSWWFLWIPSPPGRWNGFLAIFVRFQDGTFPRTTFTSPSAWHASPLISRALAMDDLAWMQVVFLGNLSPDHMYPSGGFSSNRVNCVKPVQGSDKSRDPSMFQ